MTRAIWSLAAIAGVVWSLFAWGAYAVIAWLGDAIAANAHWITDHAEALSWLTWTSGLLGSVGAAGVIVVWLIGIGLIVVAALAAALLARQARPSRDGYPLRIDRRRSDRAMPPSRRVRHIVRRMLDRHS